MLEHGLDPHQYFASNTNGIDDFSACLQSVVRQMAKYVRYCFTDYNEKCTVRKSIDDVDNDIKQEPKQTKLCAWLKYWPEKAFKVVHKLVETCANS